MDIEDLKPYFESQASPSMQQLRFLENQLFEEWKIIQSKIDKLGEFKFHIKNWSATVAVAVIAGVLVSGVSPYCIFAASLPTAAFWIQESRQERLHTLLSIRADRLEAALDRIALSYSTTSQRTHRAILLRAVKAAPGLAKDISNLTKSRDYQKWKLADRAFYTLEFVLIVAAFVGAYIKHLEPTATQAFEQLLATDLAAQSVRAHKIDAVTMANQALFKAAIDSVLSSRQINTGSGQSAAGTRAINVPAHIPIGAQRPFDAPVTLTLQPAP